MFYSKRKNNKSISKNINKKKINISLQLSSWQSAGVIELTLGKWIFYHSCHSNSKCQCWKKNWAENQKPRNPPRMSARSGGKGNLSLWMRAHRERSKSFPSALDRGCDCERRNDPWGVTSPYPTSSPGAYSCEWPPATIGRICSARADGSRSSSSSSSLLLSYRPRLRRRLFVVFFVCVRVFVRTEE